MEWIGLELQTAENDYEEFDAFHVHNMYQESEDEAGKEAIERPTIGE